MPARVPCLRSLPPDRCSFRWGAGTACRPSSGSAGDSCRLCPTSFYWRTLAPCYDSLVTTFSGLCNGLARIRPWGNELLCRAAGRRRRSPVRGRRGGLPAPAPPIAGGGIRPGAGSGCRCAADACETYGPTGHRDEAREEGLAAPRGRDSGRERVVSVLSFAGRPGTRQGSRTPHRGVVLPVDAHSLAVACGCRGVSRDIWPASHSAPAAPRAVRLPDTTGTAPRPARHVAPRPGSRHAGLPGRRGLSAPWRPSCPSVVRLPPRATTNWAYGAFESTIKRCIDISVRLGALEDEVSPAAGRVTVQCVDEIDEMQRWLEGRE